ncbi:carboxypeptidase-like regulatory domain-containing protein [Myxococcus qinghaiensis]|uniref:carboxypeptidase-like regulatory domain-containing protein n=1 Tax=Myxococcus qinghaiensis TaxID=2906758 RepID=UPI0020A7E319|nr:carboxypeptidase regulatory-like domain-containing protein [Myxococcus qinghaiensis]MCP3165826.1 carboxypeptidase-like regulatory domain-containing protein [Myxococcus qinghaiensis]
MNAVIPRMLCGLLGLFGSQALAQSSALVGTVVEARSLQPMADVVVTVTSPTFPGDLVVLTDAQGTYRVPELSPGTYTLVFEKESYQPFMRDNVQLRLNRTLRVNITLPLLLTEPVEVIGKPPHIDVGALNTCLNVSEEWVKCPDAARPVTRCQGNDSGTSRFEPEAEAGPVTKEPSVSDTPPRYNVSPAMPGMSMTLRLHPVPGAEGPKSPRRGPPLSRARFLLQAAPPSTSASREAPSSKRPHATGARTALSRSQQAHATCPRTALSRSQQAHATCPRAASSRSQRAHATCPRTASSRSQRAHVTCARTALSRSLR